MEPGNPLKRLAEKQSAALRKLSTEMNSWADDTPRWHASETTRRTIRAWATLVDSWSIDVTAFVNQPAAAAAVEGEGDGLQVARQARNLTFIQTGLVALGMLAPQFGVGHEAPVLVPEPVAQQVQVCVELQNEIVVELGSLGLPSAVPSEIDRLANSMLGTRLVEWEGRSLERLASGEWVPFVTRVEESSGAWRYVPFDSNESPPSELLDEAVSPVYFDDSEIEAALREAAKRKIVEHDHMVASVIEAYESELSSE